MTKYYEFDCGCKVEIVDDKIKDYDGLPYLNIDFDNLNLNCPIVWELFASGRTRGVFQLETPLGAHWAKKLQPVCIDEVAALLSLLRPGTLKAIVDGKNMTQHYVDRKHGIDSYEPLHESVEDIMQNTYGIMVYQEQSMKIAERLAGFDLKQADGLRKAIGKKMADLMEKVKVEFIEGCEKTGIVDSKKANEIFDIIEKSNRYSFNASHAFGYSIISYWTAWCKAHFPLHFIKAQLSYADRDDIGDFIDDAKQIGVKVKNPSICLQNKDYTILDKKVYCGIGNIKGIGESSAIDSLKSIAELQELIGKNIQDFSWKEVLILIGDKFKKTVFINLVAAGGFSHLNVYRKRMMFEYNQFLQLTGKNEIPWLIDNIDKFETLDDGLEQMLKVPKIVSSTRKNKIKDIINSLRDKKFTTVDDEEWVANIEEELIGGSLSCSKLDLCDTSCGNTTCREYNNTNIEKSVNIACEVTRISEYLPKNGKKMLYVTIKDSTAQTECIIYSDNVDKLQSLIFKGNTVCITGKRTKKGSLSITDAIQI